VTNFRQAFLDAALGGRLGDEKFVRLVLDLEGDVDGPTVLSRGSDHVERMLRASGSNVQSILHRAVDVERAWAVNSDVCLRFPVEMIPDLLRMDGIRSVRPTRRHLTQHHVGWAAHDVFDRGQSPLTGRGVRVAVIDSGIDTHHPDLQGRIDMAASMNFSSEGPSHVIEDMSGHGTHVAGIIAGSGKTYRGIAPEATLIICKVFDHHGTAEEGRIDLAVQHAIAQGAHLINFSGGFAPILNGVPIVPPPWVWAAGPTKEERAFEFAASKGILGVVAAGNYGHLGPGTISNPATSRDVLTVGAIQDANRLRRSFSSLGPVRRSTNVLANDIVDSLDAVQGKPSRNTRKPNLAAIGGELTNGAPCGHGRGVVGLKANAVHPHHPCLVGAHLKMAGTSQATPLVAGLAALAVQRLSEAGYGGAPMGTRSWTSLLRGLLLKACVTGEATCGRGIPSILRLEALLDDLVAGRLSPAQLR
jgi:subtilisin family serine protease